MVADYNHQSHLRAQENMIAGSEKIWLICEWNKWVGPADDHYFMIRKLYGPFTNFEEADSYRKHSEGHGCSGTHGFYLDSKKPAGVVTEHITWPRSVA